MACVVIFFVFQNFRLDHGLRANRNENRNGMVALAFFTLFSVILYLYFTFLTTYVLIVEVIFGMIGIFFPVVELIISLINIQSLGAQRASLA